MCLDLNFEYWVITPTQQWDALEHQKAWLDCGYPNNKGLAIKTLREQLLWYENNSFNKERSKAKEILEGLP
ncbi:15538_t:CDS:1, partial [Cetraspora pellucida]